MSMRRSVRDAIVGFSIVGAVVAFAGTLLWLRGVRLGAKVWSIKVNFPDATGLAERSPVTYRGKTRCCTAYAIGIQYDGFIRENIHNLDIPFIVLHGEADTVTDPEMSKFEEFFCKILVI